VWGRQDQAFPFENHQAALHAIPRAIFLPVDGAGLSVPSPVSPLATAIRLADPHAIRLADLSLICFAVPVAIQ
jgi:hypothetical protein